MLDTVCHDFYKYVNNIFRVGHVDAETQITDYGRNNNKSYCVRLS